MDERESRQVWARQTGDALEIDELKAEIERLAFRQLTLYGPDGAEVFTMTIGPRGSRWTAAENQYIPEVARVEVE